MVNVGDKARFKYIWDHLMIGLILLTIGYAPYRTAFMLPETGWELYVFETFTDVLFVIDVIIGFLTPYE